MGPKGLTGRHSIRARIATTELGAGTLRLAGSSSISDPVVGHECSVSPDTLAIENAITPVPQAAISPEIVDGEGFVLAMVHDPAALSCTLIRSGSPLVLDTAIQASPGGTAPLLVARSSSITFSAVAFYATATPCPPPIIR